MPDALLWHTTRNLAVTANSISKTSGCNGCADAGAVSLQRVASGDAALEFTVASASPLMSVGFTLAQTLPAPKALVVSLWFQNGIAEVREKSVYRADIAYKKGDRFGIRIEGGKVKYTRNGTVFYTSTRAVSYPLYAGTIHNNTGATLQNLVLAIDGAPALANLAGQAGKSGELIVTWTTDLPAQSLLQFGGTSLYGTSTPLVPTLSKAHRAVVSGVAPGSKVHLRAIVQDTAGQFSSSADLLATSPL
jgi:hypothetical protein